MVFYLTILPLKDIDVWATSPSYPHQILLLSIFVYEIYNLCLLINQIKHGLWDCIYVYGEPNSCLYEFDAFLGAFTLY